MINGRVNVRLIITRPIAIVHADEFGVITVTLRRVPEGELHDIPPGTPRCSAAFDMINLRGELWELEAPVVMRHRPQWYIPLWAVCYVEPSSHRLVLSDFEPHPTPQDVPMWATIYRASTHGGMMYEHVRTVRHAPLRQTATGDW